MNFNFKDIYLEDSNVVVGTIEGNGPLKEYFDSIDDCKDSSFENSEIDILYKSIDMLLEKNNLKIDDISLAIGGELSNQLTTTSYTFRSLLVSLIGVYAACSTITLAIGLSAIILSNQNVNKIMAFTSSHNQSAERQFRNPVEYGGNKEETQTFTSTVGATVLLSRKKSLIKISSFTCGKVIDVGFTDACDFGRAMAPAAIETLLSHFRETNTKPSDYDLILTGDLSKYGSVIVKETLEQIYGRVSNYSDCGLMLYDLNKQRVLAGGSGPGTAAAVLLGYVKKRMEKGYYNRVLLCATGALMNPTMINQKNSLPCIAHIIVLEARK